MTEAAQSAETGRRSSPGGKWPPLPGMAAVAISTEVAAVVATTHLQLATGWFVAAHLVIVAGLAWRMARIAASGRDVRLPSVLLLATAVAGPIGATLASLALLLTPPRRGGSALLEAWYRRIAEAAALDGAAQLAADVATGRTIDASAPVPQAFCTVIAEGTLAERQTALGLIARKFHPQYAAALDAALKSPEPVVRVQAAAVAARVRRDLQARVRALLAEADGVAVDPGRALHIAGELQGALDSGLLDEGDRIRVADAIRCSRTAAACALDPCRPETAALLGDRSAAMALEDELLASGRFAEFRHLRKRRRIAERGLFVVRHRRKAAHSARRVRG